MRVFLIFIFFFGFLFSQALGSFTLSKSNGQIETNHILEKKNGHIHSDHKDYSINEYCVIIDPVNSLKGKSLFMMNNDFGANYQTLLDCCFRRHDSPLKAMESKQMDALPAYILFQNFRIPC